MKKTIIFISLIFLLSTVWATQTITNLTVNTPIPIDSDLVVTGDYNNTDSSNNIYCKFVVIDPSLGNVVIDRFTDELTFDDGSFYSQKKLTEPKYFRESNYTLRVTCGGISEDANFFVGQRQNITNQFLGEIFFLRDNGDILSIMFFLGLIGVVIIGGAFVLFYRAFREGRFIF